MRPTDDLGSEYDARDDATLCSAASEDLDRHAAGPSSLAMAASAPSPSGSGAATNGHTNGHGFVRNGTLVTNGSFGAPSGMMGNGVVTNGKASAGALVGATGVKRVSIPGEMMYDDVSNLKREEYVRLVIQSLRDVGYMETAATLEAESGYALEAPEVTAFRQYVLDGEWEKAESILAEIGVEHDDNLSDARFLINQQKYLELLEAGKTTDALYVLRNELATLDVDPDQLHGLSSLIMCSHPDDLRVRAGWDGAHGNSRRSLLASLHRYVPAAIMIPPRRMAALLTQARAYQLHQCVYHNVPATTFSIPPSLSQPPTSPRTTPSLWPSISSRDLTSTSSSSSLSLHSLSHSPTSSILPGSSNSLSLYSDHYCDPSMFPRVTTTILEVHTDEVWNVEWSHDGTLLASGGKDRMAIIWVVGTDSEPSAWAPRQILRDHKYAVGCLAWSTDDTILLTGAEQDIHMWNTRTGASHRHIHDAHDDAVTAMEWLPDGSGFISASLDKTIIHWDAHGNKLDSWGAMDLRITDIAVTPDLTRIIAVGMDARPMGSPGDGLPPSSHSNSGIFGGSGSGSNPGPASGAVSSRLPNNLVNIYDLRSKRVEATLRTEGELTSVKVSQDSNYVLINHAPDEIHLWDLAQRRIARKFTGQRQGHHVIRSCFGGADGNFVVSGSEDANVYIWHRDTGALLEVLSGHGLGSVNCVAWNPKNERMFASCSDDHTIRIWEAPSGHSAAAIAASSSSGVHRHVPTSSTLKGKEYRPADGIDPASGTHSLRL